MLHPPPTLAVGEGFFYVRAAVVLIFRFPS